MYNNINIFISGEDPGFWLHYNENYFKRHAFARTFTLFYWSLGVPKLEGGGGGWLTHTHPDPPWIDVFSNWP